MVYDARMSRADWMLLIGLGGPVIYGLGRLALAVQARRFERRMRREREEFEREMIRKYGLAAWNRLR